MAKRRPDPHSQYSAGPPRRRKRRFSVWTLIAPGALVLVVFAFWITIGSSDVTNDTAGAGDEAAQVEASEQEAEAERARKFEARKKSVRLQAGGSLEAIADDNGMTLEELLALNKQIKDPRVVQVGQIVYLRERNG